MLPVDFDLSNFKTDRVELSPCLPNLYESYVCVVEGMVIFEFYPSYHSG